jgi:hypothetical protein
MLFLKQIAAELTDESSTIRSEAKVDSTSGSLTFRQSSIFEGEESYTWLFSVLARDIDPQLVEVTQPDSANVRHLRLVCALYRDAISGTRLRPGHVPHHQRLIRLELPLNADISDMDEVLRSFRGFLTAFGSKPPVIYPAAIMDLLAPLHAALAHASGVQAPGKDGKVVYQQSATLDEQKLLLVRESHRSGFAPDRWTFELLSLDVPAITCRELPGCGLWDVTLPSVERLETTMWEIRRKNVERWWYTSILFSDQITAQQFATACTNSVPQLRERLHHANYGVRPGWFSGRADSVSVDIFASGAARH